MKIIKKLSMEEVERVSYECGIHDVRETISYIQDWAQVYRGALGILLGGEKNKIDYMKEHDVLTDADIENFAGKAMKMHGEVEKSMDMQMYVRKRAAVENALLDAKRRHDEKSEKLLKETLSYIDDPMNYISDMVSDQTRKGT
ncbi:MAG: hypothetical protein KAT35_01560 [Candidatus Aenigmarchaeota archaeon]|nr:hypothetical protein [Candidatus Aenigmarchaeota archaeon]